jgi:hypothetical protein
LEKKNYIIKTLFLKNNSGVSLFFYNAFFFSWLKIEGNGPKTKIDFIKSGQLLPEFKVTDSW